MRKRFLVSSCAGVFLLLAAFMSGPGEVSALAGELTADMRTYRICREGLARTAAFA